MSRTPIQEAIRLALKQNGVISRAQALDCGLSVSAIQRLLKGEVWIRLHEGVYALNGSDDSVDRKLFAAHLWLGPESVVSHRAAAARHGFDGFDFAPLEFSTTSSRRRGSSDVIVHRVKSLARRDVVTIRGIPATGPTRTLLDLGAVSPENRLELALEHALREGKTCIPKLRDQLTGAGRGVRGAAKLRRLVDWRGDDYVPAGSPAQVVCMQVMRRFRLPRGLNEYEIFDGTEFIARPDFYFPEKDMVIEVESWEWHQGRQKLDRDSDRRTALTSRGYRVLTVTMTRLRNDPEGFVADFWRMWNTTLVSEVRSARF
ncbi:MAG: hypothetical protein QOH90_782 [Actinomycetota bacterium]|jgi:hypothetical protein|nr:hypothetical protein [Actinomycetota bacterium]